MLNVSRNCHYCYCMYLFNAITGWNCLLTLSSTYVCGVVYFHWAELRRMFPIRMLLVLWRGDNWKSVRSPGLGWEGAWIQGADCGQRDIDGQFARKLTKIEDIKIVLGRSLCQIGGAAFPCLIGERKKNSIWNPPTMTIKGRGCFGIQTISVENRNIWTYCRGASVADKVDVIKSIQHIDEIESILLISHQVHSRSSNKQPKRRSFVFNCFGVHCIKIESPFWQQIAFCNPVTPYIHHCPV